VGSFQIPPPAPSLTFTSFLSGRAPALAIDRALWSEKGCFEHLVTYATTPPELPTSFEHSDDMRFAQAGMLGNLGEKYKVNQWIDASQFFRKSGELIIELCKAAMKQHSEKCSGLVTQIADLEEKAYSLLEHI
jgi:hypothetical protein